MKYVVFNAATHGEWCDICCAVTYNSVTKKHTYYFSPDSGKKPLVNMSQGDKVVMFSHLKELTEQGFTIFGWGTQSYHLPLLYQETGLEGVKELAKSHVDLQFDLLDNTGMLYPLVGVARWLGMELDPSMSKRVPELWNSGDINNMREVLRHVKTQVDIVNRLVEVMYPEDGDNQLPLSVGFIDANWKEFTLPTTGLPVSYTAMAYSSVKKHSLQTPYIKALEWIGLWS